MSEHIYLTGAEDVQRAGHAMQNSASEMTRAAAQIDDTLMRFGQRMEEWVQRLEALSQEGQK